MTSPDRVRSLIGDRSPIPDAIASPAVTSRATPIQPRPGLSLVPAPAPQPAHATSPHYSPLALWHLLSLDAPTVATLWTFAIARALDLHLAWTEPAAMFIAVWMLYAADRILDARLLDARPLPGGQPPPGLPPDLPPDLPSDLEERHRFHHLHRRAFLFIIVLAACVLAALLHALDPRALHLYALLATLLGAWLLLIHARPLPTADTHRLPKELAVGIFFPAAVFIPTVARLPQLRLDLLLPALLFAAVCTLNCLFLYAWEHPVPRPRAHWTTRWATHHLAPLALGLAVASATLLIASLLHALPTSSILMQHASALLAACTLSSALLLFLLHHCRRRIQPIHLRALADLVLLTPALILPLASLIAR
jgi:hypothetical protein